MSSRAAVLVMARRVAMLTCRQQQQQASARKCSSSSVLSIAGEKTLTEFEKRVMVWGGAFKSRFEVPTKVPHSMYQKCQERFRIKMNIYGMAFTAVACTVVMYMGAQDEDHGLSLHAQALQRHAEAAASAAGH